MEAFIVEINAWAWGVPMQVLLLGTGMFLTLGLGFLTWRRLGFAFQLLLPQHLYLLLLEWFRLV